MARLDWYIRAGLKLRHMQLLVALDELRHVGRVAAHLNVTQPAVSKTLAALEAGLQLPLFTRNSKGMEPTEHGACLIRHARDILGRLNDAHGELRDISEGRISRVSLGVLPAMAVLLVPRFIARLEAQSAAVAVSVREGTMDTLLPALRANDVDLAVGILSEHPMSAEFGSELLMEDPIVAVVRRGHPLVRARRLSWSRLADYPMVLPPASATTRASLEALFSRHRMKAPRRHVESVSTMTNVGTLQFTDSVGFLSRALAQHFVGLGILSMLPLAMPEARMRVGLIWMADRRMGKAQKLVRELFRETRDTLVREAVA